MGRERESEGEGEESEGRESEGGGHYLVESCVPTCNFIE